MKLVLVNTRTLGRSLLPDGKVVVFLIRLSNSDFFLLVNVTLHNLLDDVMLHLMLRVE